MHPYLSGQMAEAHREDLLREAGRYRLVAQARAARPRHALPQWQAVAARVGEKVRRFAKPAPVATAGCAPQPVCCPA